MLFELKGNTASIDMGIRFNFIEKYLEEFENEQMSNAGFTSLEIVRRPTFFSKIFEGDLNSLDVEKLCSDKSQFFAGEMFTKERIDSYLDGLIRHICPVEFQSGGSVYLAKRALAYISLKNENLDSACEDVISNIDGVKAYQGEIAKFVEWLRQKKG